MTSVFKPEDSPAAWVPICCQVILTCSVVSLTVRIKLPDPPASRPNSDQPLLACDSGE